jgi:hypothetical protein
MFRVECYGSGDLQWTSKKGVAIPYCIVQSIARWLVAERSQIHIIQCIYKLLVLQLRKINVSNYTTEVDSSKLVYEQEG